MRMSEGIEWGLHCATVLAALLVFGVPIGLWQQLAPRSFYDSFPGFGRTWVSPDGPFTEHLVRDIGGRPLA